MLPNKSVLSDLINKCDAMMNGYLVATFFNDLLKLNDFERFMPVYCAKIEQTWEIRKAGFIDIRQTALAIKVELSKMYAAYDSYCKLPKVFISHSTKDYDIVDKFVSMLERIGVKQDQLFCSSVQGYGIPQGAGNIYDYIRSEMDNSNLFVIMMLSDNYYSSPACLNEMGAAWIKQAKYQSILLPNFDYKKIDGAIDPRNISFKLDDNKNRGYALTDLYKNIIEHLNIEEKSSSAWERIREDFITSIDASIVKGDTTE